MRTVRMTQPEPSHILCGVCGMEWAVSPQDPDSTLDDARAHLSRRHQITTDWHEHIRGGQL